MRSLTKWSAALYRAAAKLQLISPAHEENKALPPPTWRQRLLSLDARNIRRLSHLSRKCRFRDSCSILTSCEFLRIPH
jgi:hypothetical protein